MSKKYALDISEELRKGSQRAPQKAKEVSALRRAAIRNKESFHKCKEDNWIAEVQFWAFPTIASTL